MACNCNCAQPNPPPTPPGGAPTTGDGADDQQLYSCKKAQGTFAVTLKPETEHLSTTRRREVAERIKEAREFGDISENAEYDDAKNEQAMLEARIAQLEDKLRSAKVIDA